MVTNRYKVLDGAASTTDSVALDQRIASYAKFASRDINEVLLRGLVHFDLLAPLKILDLGCGTGKQTLWLARNFPNAQICAVDLSPEALAQIDAQQLPNVRTILGSYDDPALQKQVLDQGYDVIVSFFSLYYAGEFEKWLMGLRTVLNPSGRMILVGYSHRNNAEIVDLAKQCGGVQNEVNDFVSSAELERVFGLPNVQIEHFVNQMNFADYDSFEGYYSSYGLYDSKIDQHVKSEFQRGVRSNFTWTKDSLVVIFDQLCLDKKLPDPLRCDRFDLESYREFLQKVKKAGYAVLRFKDLDLGRNSAKKLLLRHDVDLDLNAALAMAELEADEGVCSTYFIMANGEYYNPFSVENRALIRKIESLGHEIGLHYDQEIEDSVRLLNTLLCHPIQVVSQHNPTLNGKNPMELSLMDAYDPKLQSEFQFEYVSDSGKKWRKYDLESVLKFEQIYLLIHPESWAWGELDIVEMIRFAESKQLRKYKASFSEFARQNVRYHRARAGL